MPDTITCTVCGTTFQPRRPGPARYCTTRCRRLREYAIRRAQHAIEHADHHAALAREALTMRQAWQNQSYLQSQVTFWQAEANMAADRLAELL